MVNCINKNILYVSVDFRISLAEALPYTINYIIISFEVCYSGVELSSERLGNLIVAVEYDHPHQVRLSQCSTLLKIYKTLHLIFFLISGFSTIFINSAPEKRNYYNKTIELINLYDHLCKKYKK